MAAKESIEVFEAEMMVPGIGPAPHYHADMEEHFFVLDGEVQFYVDGDEVVLGAGKSISVPRNTVHAWKSYSSQSKMVFMFTPAANQWEYLRSLTEIINQRPHDYNDFLEELFERYDQNRAEPVQAALEDVEKYW